MDRSARSLDRLPEASSPSENGYVTTKTRRRFCHHANVRVDVTIRQSPHPSHKRWWRSRRLSLIAAAGRGDRNTALSRAVRDALTSSSKRRPAEGRVSRLSPVAGGRAHVDVISLAEQIPLEELPEFVGVLAHAQSLATLRLMGQGGQTNPPASASLLTAEEVATALRISEANVYARAKTDLKAAAVDVGPGQLRFDRDSIDRFINARRRG